MALLKMILDNGINVTLDHDTVLNPWHPLSTGNMLYALYTDIHIDRVMGWSDLFKVLNLVTVNAAKAWRKGGEEYGAEEGRRADLVVLNALTDVDAIRFLEPLLYVVRRGS